MLVPGADPAAGALLGAPIGTAAGWGDASRARPHTRGLSATTAFPPLRLSTSSPAPRLSAAELGQMLAQHLHPSVNTHLSQIRGMPANFCKHCLQKKFANNFCKLFFSFFLNGEMPPKTTHASDRVKCIKSSCQRRSGRGNAAESQRGDHRQGPRAQPEPAGRLGQPWELRHTAAARHRDQRQHRAAPSIPLGMLQTRMDRNGDCCCCLSAAADDVPRLRPAGTSQKRTTNSTASLQQRPCSPSQLAPRRCHGSSPGPTAGVQPPSAALALPRRFWGALRSQPPLPAGSPSRGYLFAGEPLPPAF